MTPFAVSRFFRWPRVSLQTQLQTLRPTFLADVSTSTWKLMQVRRGVASLIQGRVGWEARQGREAEA